MRFPPLSLLAFPLSTTNHIRHHCDNPTTLFNQRKPYDQAISEEVTANALKFDVPTTEQKKKRRRKTKRTSKYNRLTTRQKSIHLGNDPIISLNLNLDHLAKSQNPASALRAEEMLLRIEALHADGYYEKPPDVVSYNCVINAYAHGRGVDDRLGNGERLLRRMAERGIEPNEITYNTLLRCLWKEMEDVHVSNISLRKEKVEKAESILGKMEKLKLSNTRSYNTLISILSKSNLKVAPERAEYWLRRMMKLYDFQGEERLEPDVCSFNSVIHAYASSIIDSRHSKHHTENNLFYAQKAEELLEEMTTLYNSGRESVKPDVVSYSAVINAYARAASRDDEWCADRAVQILEMVERNVLDEVKGSVKPNKKTYASVINAFAKIGNAEAADKILTKMKTLGNGEKHNKLKPDTVCYTSVIDAYAKKGGEEAADRAEELLREMEELYKLGDLDVRPNIRTYCAVIGALGKSGRPRYAEKAEQLLDEMESLYSTHGIRDLAPNTICYNAVINAYAQSNNISKAHRTELLLERMLEESKNGNIRIRPNTITFNSVINAAAQSSCGDEVVRKEAYLIALNAFKTLHGLDYCKPSSITYSSFLKVLQNLIETGETRDYMARKVFALSARMELDNDTVRLQLRRTCSSKLLAKQVLELVDRDRLNAGSEE